MWQFIISGYVPGTNYQVSLEMVELLALGLLALVVARKIVVYYLTFFLNTKVVKTIEKISI